MGFKRKFLKFSRDNLHPQFCLKPVTNEAEQINVIKNVSFTKSNKIWMSYSVVMKSGHA